MVILVIVHKQYPITKKIIYFPRLAHRFGHVLRKGYENEQAVSWLRLESKNSKVPIYLFWKQPTEKLQLKFKLYYSNCITQIVLHCPNAPSFYNYFNNFYNIFPYVDQKVISMIFQKWKINFWSGLK